jgi:uncharacterized YccA/Bax inhibitor family protein
VTVATSPGASGRSGNPAFGERFEEYANPSLVVDRRMTVLGTALKSVFLLLVLIAGGAYGWASATAPVGQDAGSGYGNTTVTIPGGFWIVSLATLFLGIFIAVNPRLAGIGGIVYAALEGYLLGAISAMFDAQTEGIVGAAVLCTLGVFVVALFLYVTRIIKPTARLAFGVAAGIGGLLLMGMFVWVLAIFDWAWLYSDEFQTVGLVVGGLAIVLAALSLTLDFGTIEGGAQAGAPKFVEWYAAWGLMVTLIWLYITILRVLALLARNR